MFELCVAMASQISDKKRTKKTKKRSRVESEEFERINSLNWNPTLTEKDDAFSFLIGSNELEGGFFFFLSFCIESAVLLFSDGF